MMDNHISSVTDELPLILVVDDHRPAAEMISRLFEKNNYRTGIVHSGQEALEYTRHTRPAIILLDIMMPGMDGFEVLEALRQHPVTEDIPVIFITAKDDASDVEQGLQLGADDYVTKPVRPRELLARVKSKLEAHALREALRQRTTDLEALLRVSEELNNHLNIDELQDLILYLVLDLLPADVAITGRLNESGYLMSPHEVNKSDQSYDIKTVLQDIIPQLDDSGKAITWQPGDIELVPEQAGMALGFWHGEDLHGLLIVLGQSSYDMHQQRLFESMGRQATLALRNAELYAVKVNYANHLEDMVEERTAELRSAQELLVRSEKLASVGRLSAGIAHEINNPLQPIILNMELLLEDFEEAGMSDTHISDIQETLKSAKRIRRIVERLLQFTRRRGDNTPEMEHLSLNTIINNVLNLSDAYVRKSGITIETQLVPDTYIHGNRDQLEQVFLNMVLNAKAAMDDGGTLTIKSERHDGTVLLQFVDTGHGISPELLNQIFEPFISTREDGSGLGLFVSHEIILNHSGSIDVESNVGKGTTFTLSLPTVQEDID